MRKHDNFTFGGPVYAPELWNFYHNGKKIHLDSGTISTLAQYVICGNKKRAIDELKRLLRKEEKKPLKAGMMFYNECEDGRNAIWCRQLMYKDLKTGLVNLGEWKKLLEKEKERPSLEKSEGYVILGEDNKCISRKSCLLLSDKIRVTPVYYSKNLLAFGY